MTTCPNLTFIFSLVYTYILYLLFKCGLCLQILFFTRKDEIACFTFTVGVVEKCSPFFRVPLSSLTISSMVFTSGSLWIGAVDDDGLRPVFSLPPLPSSAGTAASFIHLPLRDLRSNRLQMLHLLHDPVQCLTRFGRSYNFYNRLEKAIHSIQT